tara:strand:+ start:130 stop:339 length:210 start_codon:yes stop_codon:yes gene_type:complete
MAVKCLLSKALMSRRCVRVMRRMRRNCMERLRSIECNFSRTIWSKLKKEKRRTRKRKRTISIDNRPPCK